MKGKFIPYIVVTVIIFMSITAYYIKTNQKNNIQPQMTKNLISKYEEYIKNGRYSDAYYELTSTEYKKRTTLAQYLNSQNSNKGKYGRLKSLKPLSGLFLRETSSTDKTIIKATFIYSGEKSAQRIIIDAVKENGKYKIDNTYNSYVSIGGLLPVIY